MKEAASIIPLESAYSFQEGPGLRKWQFKSEGIKVLNVGNITKDGRLDLSKTDRFISKEEVNARYQHFLVDDGDLVIASSGISFDEDGFLRTRGVFVGKEDLPLCMNTSTIRFKPKKDISDLFFLRHWIDGPEFRTQISKLVTGSAQQNFGPSHLRSIQITLPSLNEQRRIAAILDKADALRHKRKRAIYLLDSLTQSIFLEMFGDPIENLKELPIAALEEVVSPSRKITYGILKPGPDCADGVPYVRVVDIRNSLIDVAGLKRTTTTIASEYKRSTLRGGDLLISIRGHVGRMAITPPECDGANITQDTARLAIIGANTEFVKAQLETEPARHWMTQRTKGAAVKGINLGDLRRFPLILPPRTLQDEFAAKISIVRAMLEQCSRQMDNLDTFFASLQSRAFSGQL